MKSELTDEQEKIMKEAETIVYRFFKDQRKVNMWIVLPNPHLGGASPKDLIRWGRGHELIKFLKANLIY